MKDVHHGHKEKMGKHGGFHGSPKETHEIHGGRHEGPKELTVGSTPGKTGMAVKPSSAKSSFEKPGKMPKTGKAYSEE